MTAFTEAHALIAREFANVAAQTLGVGGSMHPGAVVAATARMAGTYLFRSFELAVPGASPGQALLSEQATERADALIRIAAAIVHASGITLDSPRAGTAIDASHQPQRPFLDTQRQLEPLLRPIRERAGLSDYEAARAAAVAAAYLVVHCAKVMEPNTGFRVAAYGIVEGCKTAPDPVRLAALAA